MKRQTLVLLAAASASAAFAQSTDTYQCSMDGLARRVEVVRRTAAPVPCEVLYFKDTEAPGERQVLWSASNDARYCESQAQSFVAQLESWGWQCQAPVQAAAPVEPPADDTDALAAPEPE